MRFIVIFVICATFLFSLYGGRVLADAEEDYRAIFGEQAERVASSATKTDDAEFAAKLLKAARSATDSPKLQIVLCRKAYEFGVCNPTGYDTAMSAVDMLKDLAPERMQQWKADELELLRKFYRSAPPSKKQQTAGEYLTALTNMGDASAAAHDYQQALKHYNKAIQIAAYIKSPARSALIRKAGRIKTLQQHKSRAEGLKKVLENNPDKTVIRRSLVMLYVVELDQPKKAIEYLSPALNEVLRSYVPLAAGDVKKIPRDTLPELGRWYESLVNDGSRYGKVNVLKRAISYYRQYLELAENKDSAYLKVQAALNEAEDKLIRLRSGGQVAALLKGAAVVLTFEKGTFFKRKEHIYTRDVSGSGNHGVVRGPKPTSGLAGDALKFDGESYIYLSNKESLQITGDQTIAMWLRPANFKYRRNPYGKAYGGEGTMTLEKDGTINYYFGQSGENSSPYQSYRLNDNLKEGRWTHIAVVRDLDAKTVTWYKNGVIVNRYKVESTTVKASSNSAYVGYAYTKKFLGLIDEFGMWSRSLSAEEIRTLYKLGANGFPLSG